MTARESWWPHRDYVRVAGRVNALVNRDQPPSPEEIAYLRGSVMLLLTAPLPLPNDEARNLRELLPILEGIARRLDDGERAA